jgi:hypothetical protein
MFCPTTEVKALQPIYHTFQLAIAMQRFGELILYPRYYQKFSAIHCDRGNSQVLLRYSVNLL